VFRAHEAVEIGGAPAQQRMEQAEAGDVRAAAGAQRLELFAQGVIQARHVGHEAAAVSADGHRVAEAVQGRAGLVAFLRAHSQHVAAAQQVVDVGAQHGARGAGGARAIVVDAHRAVNICAFGLDGDQHVGLTGALAGLNAGGCVVTRQVAQQQHGFVECVFGNGIARLELAGHQAFGEGLRNARAFHPHRDTAHMRFEDGDGDGAAVAGEGLLGQIGLREQVAFAPVVVADGVGCFGQAGQVGGLVQASRQQRGQQLAGKHRVAGKSEGRRFDAGRAGGGRRGRGLPQLKLRGATGQQLRQRTRRFQQGSGVRPHVGTRLGQRGHGTGSANAHHPPGQSPECQNRGTGQEQTFQAGMQQIVAIWL
jgi:hypothetical protein